MRISDLAPAAAQRCIDILGVCRAASICVRIGWRLNTPSLPCGVQQILMATRCARNVYHNVGGQGRYGLEHGSLHDLRFTIDRREHPNSLPLIPRLFAGDYGTAWHGVLLFSTSISQSTSPILAHGCSARGQKALYIHSASAGACIVVVYIRISPPPRATMSKSRLVTSPCTKILKL